MNTTKKYIKQALFCFFMSHTLCVSNVNAVSGQSKVFLEEDLIDIKEYKFTLKHKGAFGFIEKREISLDKPLTIIYRGLTDNNSTEFSILKKIIVYYNN